MSLQAFADWAHEEKPRPRGLRALPGWFTRVLDRDESEVDNDPVEPLEPSRLVAIHPDIVQPSEFILETDVCTIGRYGTCNVVVRAFTISRLHAKIERNGPRYVLHDTDSANGTFLNGRRLLEPLLLKDEDEIGLGTAMAILRFEDADPTFCGINWLRYDDQELVFYLNQKRVDLTPTEFRLLHHLYNHAGNVCTRESCAEAIWGQEKPYDPNIDDDTINRVISNIRQKMRDIVPDVDMIDTRRGIGYILHL